MLKKYILAFLISMVPLIELRGGVPAAMAMGMSAPVAIAVCAIGNMLPVPIIYLFARKVLIVHSPLLTCKILTQYYTTAQEVSQVGIQT